MTPKLIAPSVLAADFANLQRDIEMINNSQADWFHIDIMDGVFVKPKGRTNMLNEVLVSSTVAFFASLTN